jgi:putative toxin-antitoxin system antitoxin component (TIGR02293 family)
MGVTALMIAEALGGRNVLRERLADYSAVVRRTREGLPYAALAAVAKRYAIPLATLARVIGLPERTLARRKKERRLRADESDRLLRVARVATAAEDILGAQAKAGRWLQAPNRALGGAIPLDLLDTDLGAEEVVTILGRIEHGVYS